MKIVGFEKWLQTKKRMGFRSSKDVISRLKRVTIMLNKEEISLEDLKSMEAKDDFKTLSTTVKSQLRRAVRLYCEFVEG